MTASITAEVCLGTFISTKFEHDGKDLVFRSPQRAVTQKAALLDLFLVILHREQAQEEDATQ